MHSRATPRLYYLRQLRRCGLSQCDLLAYYRTLNLPYPWVGLSSLAYWTHQGWKWHPRENPEACLKIIYSDIPYVACIRKVQIEFLKTRRERLSQQFLLQICQPNHRLHYLLNKHDSIMYTLEMLRNITAQFLKLNAIRAVSLYTTYFNNNIVM